MALQLWETLKEAIVAYTGLSPPTFFTLLALILALYYVVSGLFPSSDQRHATSKDFEPQMEPLRPPVQIGEVTEEELKAYDGSDRDKPLLMAIKGQIYDVSQSRMFYGPGGPYALFAGKDASRALAKMSFEEKDLTGDISGLGPFELEALQDWEYKFMGKYVKVGTIKKTVPVAEPESTSEPSESTQSTGEPSESIPRDAESSKLTEDVPSETAPVKSDESETPSKVDAHKE
ncbi:membrane steroid-binding protein 2-like isoform X2 [Abrus precatorius]|uniref:Membrane steroid-binding protein 2-like isoform X1 n=1 Tax=Abrus precatorius TaxID=3816 RepID=A0A8B8LQZ1_ABRPR|nr:membrane steroid-binding protein 2-like isoform X1 [Abrus precatorius]XP_027357848.1 membrane steroid-binding protein 2-like isoform X2 [Abrus precatorius]